METESKFDLMHYTRGRDAGKIHIVGIDENKATLEQETIDPITGVSMGIQSHDIDINKLSEIKKALEMFERSEACGNIVLLLEDIRMYTQQFKEESNV